MSDRRRILLTAVTAAVTATLADQGTKWLILEQVMQPAREIPLLPFLSLTLGFNTGVSFGMFGGTFAQSPYLLSGLMALIAGIVCLMIWRTRSLREAAAFGLIVGGALGNIADRLRLGAVVDFIDLHYAGWRWPTFNTADIAIVFGVALLLIGASGERRRRETRASGAAAGANGPNHIGKEEA